MPLVTYPGIPKLKDRACSERGGNNHYDVLQRAGLSSYENATRGVVSRATRTSGLMIRALLCSVADDPSHSE